MTKEIMSPDRTQIVPSFTSPPGLGSERGVGDGEGRSVCSSIDCPPPSELDKAIAVRDDIRGKLGNARMVLVEIDAERARIAYSAHVDGGNTKKDLDILNKRRMLQLCDIESLESAMLEASRRVTAAECEAERQRAEEAALKAIGVADKLIVVGKKLDAHFAKANEVSHEFWQIIEELGALKCGHPTYEAFRVQAGLAAMTHLMSGRFRAEHLAPRDRRSFKELAQGWRTMALNSVQQHLPQAAE